MVIFFQNNSSKRVFQNDTNHIHRVSHILSNVSRIDFNLSIAEHNKSTSNETRIVNASVIYGNELPENRNTNTIRTLQKPLTSKSLPNDPLKKVVILGDTL